MFREYNRYPVISGSQSLILPHIVPYAAETEAAFPSLANGYEF